MLPLQGEAKRAGRSAADLAGVGRSVQTALVVPVWTDVHVVHCHDAADCAARVLAVARLQQHNACRARVHGILQDGLAPAEEDVDVAVAVPIGEATQAAAIAATGDADVPGEEQAVTKACVDSDDSEVLCASVGLAPDLTESGFALRVMLERFEWEAAAFVDACRSDAKRKVTFLEGLGLQDARRITARMDLLQVTAAEEILDLCRPMRPSRRRRRLAWASAGLSQNG